MIKMASLLKKLTSVDRMFALLRILAFIGGIFWVFLSKMPAANQHELFLNFGFFLIYSLLLYLFIYLYPKRIRYLYNLVLYLDLIFVFWLVRLTGGYSSDFYLAFLLLVALHSFYFGLSFGFRVQLLSIFIYLAAGNFAVSSENYVLLGLRIVFFILVGVSMGLLSRKEGIDKKSIEKLNEELEKRRNELEQEKNKLSNILMGIDAGLILINRKKEIIWMNKVSERWFGSLNKHFGSDNFKLFNNKQTRLENPIDKSLKNGTIENFETEYMDGEDQTHYFRITSAPLFDEKGKVDQILELIQDITEEKELQLHLIQTSKLAAMGEIASGVAHEINNPLSSIAVCVQELTDLLLENLGEKKESVEILEDIETIKNEIQRCKRITTGLLNIAPRTEHRRVPLDVNQLIKNVRLLIRYKAEREHKEIKLNLAKNIPLIMGEADTLSQVFLNLILNAVEFSPAGKTIEINSEMDGNASVKVTIKDEGCGIAPQNLGKIFKPFYTTKPAGMGTGLGLPISLRIIKSLGGEIHVESQPKKGSTFTLSLPVYREPSIT